MEADLGRPPVGIEERTLMKLPGQRDSLRVQVTVEVTKKVE